jgi:hypothetical protein
MSNSSKQIATLLMGGFGNQLFQFCKTKELEEEGYKVSIDISNFEKYKNVSGLPYIHREQILPVDYFGFEETPNYVKKILDIGIKISNNRFTPGIVDFATIIHDNNIALTPYRKFNRLIGYFQDVNLIYKHKEYLIKSLSNEKKIQKALNLEPHQGTTLLHVRRGDYVGLNEELKIDFYKKALNYCREKINNFNYEIFTDDYEWVSQQNIFEDSLTVHSDGTSVENTISTFAKMLHFENYIIGNSTFSLIPALLKETDKSNIFVANPWFRNKQRNLNFRNNWIKINNQT